MTDPAAHPGHGAARPALKVIANPYPQLRTWQEHLLDVPELCPYSHNPGPGSTLSITYTAGAWFLELFALDAYLPGFVAHSVVRDNELLAQTVALEAAAVLRVPVDVELNFAVAGLRQRQRVRVHAEPADLP
ncbi:hypothetical protein [Deinococcus aquiradiocola]|uniref:Uncharacterized protein n=1 Tax=Deinococcus aquiradiocola TaxID=393059 RepID=A0A917PND8_9DEIO|nr:hypothetical protein [Deinococcus aquiradiocola]GGJ85837.1 hypothetical protein GCM10008939_32140 [Deinococcus aquiradiocola]